MNAPLPTLAREPHRARSALAAVVLLLACGCAGAARGALPVDEDAAGQAEVSLEPPVSAQEQALLEEIAPLIASDPAAAQAQLSARLAPDSSALLDFTLGGLLVAQHRAEQAVQSYERAVAKWPTFRRAWRHLAMLHVAAGGWDPAVAAISRAIELGGGDAGAQGLLGYACSGRGDHLAAEAAFRAAVALDPADPGWRHGLVAERTSLGVAYLAGEGVPRDPVEAARWLRLAAASGEAVAQSNLALLYLRGDGVPRDEVEAARLYGLAAAQGHAPSQVRLGLLCEAGRGVAQDDVAACMWYLLATGRGEPTADARRAALTEHMTSEQVAEAERRAAAWEPVSGREAPGD